MEIYSNLLNTANSTGIGTPEESTHEKHGDQVLHKGPARMEETGLLSRN